MKANDTSPSGHFTRFNAMYDRGYVGALSLNELRVFWAFERHADRHGETYPSPARIAEKLGMSERNVRKAIARLVEGGFLTGGRPGRPQGNVLKRRIMVPDKPAEIASLTPEEKRARAARLQVGNKRAGAGKINGQAQAK